jgi:hypothetical protein
MITGAPAWARRAELGLLLNAGRAMREGRRGGWCLRSAWVVGGQRDAAFRFGAVLRDG